MRPPGDGPLAEDYLYARRNDLLDDALGLAAARCFELGLVDPLVAETIGGRAQGHRWNTQLGSAVPFRAARSAGDLVVGHDAARGHPVAVPSPSLGRHGVLVGATGGGKTTFLVLLLLQLVTTVRGLLVTDTHKRELRHLRPLAARLGVELVVLPARRLRWNPLQPEPGADPWSHLAMVVSVAARTMGLGERGRSILAWACRELYHRCALGSGAGSWPTLIDVHALISETPGLNASAREAVLDRLGDTITSLGPASVGHHRGWTAADLLDRRVVLELAGLAENAKSFLTALLLQSRLVAPSLAGDAGDLHRLLIFDDAQRLIATSSTGEWGGDLPPLVESMGLLRATGTGCFFCVQSLESVPRGLLANLSTRVLLRPGLASDLQAMAAEMGLSPEQAAWARRMEAGQAVLQLADAGWREPIALRVPRAQVPPCVDDAEVERSLAPLLALPVTPAPGQAHWRPRTPHGDPVEVPPAPAPVTPASATPQPSTVLTAAELALLRAVVDHPGLPWSRYPRLAALSPKRAAPLRDELVRRGYLRLHRVALGERGRRALVPEPLAPARDAVAAAAGGSL